MACEPAISKLFSHIQACRTAELPGTRVRFSLGGAVVGYMAPDFAARLAGLTPEVRLTPGGVYVPGPAGARLNALARAAGCRVRGEDFDVRETPDGPVLAVLDRGALPDFGVIGVGAHLNGLVRREDGWWLWVAKRSADKKLDPGKLDHLVAGGVSAGMSPFETLVKEAWEEAGLPEDLARGAREVARFAYNMERPEGLRRDVLHAYDLVLPHDFTPRPQDGEVESFTLMPMADVFARVTSGDDFKFNVNLVLIDLFVRLEMLTGDVGLRLRAALAGE